MAPPPGMALLAPSPVGRPPVPPVRIPAVPAPVAIVARRGADQRGRDAVGTNVVFLIPVGASDEVGAAGFVAALEELAG